MQIEYLQKKNIPNSPGVYFFLNGKNIIYIGKATSLRNRIKSYFNKDLIRTRGPVTVDMVFRSDNLKWQKTDSVLEALILEASLIKKYQPYNNIREKDDKSWNHVCITKEKLPKVIVMRERSLKIKDADLPIPEVNVKKKRAEKNSAVGFACDYGPFTNGAQLREALKLIRRIFPFLDEKSKNGYEFYRQVHLVPDISNAENIKLYKKNIKNIKLFFEGKKKKILKSLEKEMKNYAKNREFEKAGEAKRQIFALKHINDVALMKNDTPTEQNFSRSPVPGFGYRSQTDKIFTHSSVRIEAYDIAHMSGRNMVGSMVAVENNMAVKSEYKRFKIRTVDNTNDTGALAEVLNRRLSHTEWQYPDLIIVDGGIAQINAAENILKNLNINIPVASVVKDEHHRPRAIKGDEEIIKNHKTAILLANSEAHRFAIAYHKNMRGKNFLHEKKRGKYHNNA